MTRQESKEQLMMKQPMDPQVRKLAPLLLRGGPADRRSQVLPVVAFAVVTTLALTVAGGAEFFLGLDGASGVTAEYQGIYAMLACIALVILAVPLLSLCGSAVRLATRRRDTRLASLRLLGASRRLLVGLSILESGGLAALGVVVGVLGHLALAPLVGRVPFLGGPIGADAVLPSLPVALVTVLTLVGTALAGSALGLRRVAITPLGVRTRQVPASAHWVRLLIGLGVLAALVVTVQRAAAAGSVMVGIAILVGALGLGMAVLNVLGPWLLSLLARTSLLLPAAGTRGVSRILAARTVLEDPRAVWHQVGGVAMVAFTAVVVGSGLALVSGADSGMSEPADLMLVADLRTGVLLTIALAFATMAASISVHAAAEVYDRRDLYVALDRLGTPPRALEAARRRAVTQPLVILCAVSSGAAAVLVAPMVGPALLTDPLTLAAVLGALVLGLLLVQLAVRATAGLLSQVLEAPEPVG